jgi:chromatin remodeling complex protein RSC6
MNRLAAPLIMLVVLVLIIVGGTFYQVDETEQVIVTQFGEPVRGPITKPGLWMKVPFIQTIRRFDKRVLEWDGLPGQIPTLDKQFIVARTRVDHPPGEQSMATAKKKGAGKKSAGKKAGAKKSAGKKAAAKKAPAKKAKRAPNPAFMKAMTPSAQLAPVVGANPMPRTEVTKKLWQYIKKNNLQDAKNRRMINADDKLKPVFGGKAQVSMFDMTKLVNKHLK